MQCSDGEVICGDVGAVDLDVRQSSFLVVGATVRPYFNLVKAGLSRSNESVDVSAVNSGDDQEHADLFFYVVELSGNCVGHIGSDHPQVESASGENCVHFSLVPSWMISERHVFVY